ncbi:hypothetical protein [Neobacillus dielmonensis]|uniref:hypothetical protein n=1 Tax=Neobacillus dielmonensis TaxID=1347369 RepID=UPI0005A9CA15|nr:hypothetical protein [Neobacillus dielmonensis]
MDKELQSKINSLIIDIQAVARELEEISEGIGSEFKGIGSIKSASSLQKAANKYKNVIRELRKI